MAKISPAAALCVLAALLAGATQSGAQAIIPFRSPSAYAYGAAAEFDLTETWLAPLVPRKALSVSQFSTAQAVANGNGAKGFMAMAAATDAGWAWSPEAKSIMDFVTDDPLHREQVKLVVEVLGIASGGAAPSGFPSNGGIFRVEFGEYWQVGLLREDALGRLLMRWPEIRLPPVLTIDGGHSRTPVTRGLVRVFANGVEIEEIESSRPVVYKKKIVVTVQPGVIELVTVTAQAKISGFAYVDPVIRPHPDNPEVTVTLRAVPDPAQPPLAVPSREQLVAAGIDVVPLEQAGLLDAVPCTGGVAIEQPRLVVKSRAGAEGGGTLRLRGTLELLPVPLDPPLDPVARGARVRLEDAAGAPLLDETVPGGAFDPGTGRGWRHEAGSERWVYTHPGHDGVRHLVLRRLPGEDEVYRFSAKARLADGVPTAEQLPLVATLVVDAPSAEDGQCGDALLGGAPPATPCPVHDATRLVCR